jgi:hypothetical protein
MGKKKAALAIVAMSAILIPVIWHTSVIYFDVPAGYVGWVSVRFQDPTCHQEATFFRRIRVGRDGKGCAPFPDPEGWHAEFVIYANDDGSLRKFPLSLGAPNTPNGVDPVSKVYVFFVGTKADLARSWSSEPKTR